MEGPNISTGQIHGPIHCHFAADPTIDKRLVFWNQMKSFKEINKVASAKVRSQQFHQLGRDTKELSRQGSLGLKEREAERCCCVAFRFEHAV